MTERKLPVLTAGGRAYSAQAATPAHSVLTPDDELISDPHAERTTTRKVSRPTIYPENQKDASARVSVTLMHQRRGNAAAQRDEDWNDIDAAPFSRVHAGEKVSFQLSGRETKRLFYQLVRLYKQLGDFDSVMAEIGQTVVDGTDVTVLQGPGRDQVRQWLEEEGEELFTIVDDIRPDLFHTALLRTEHQHKQAALDEFRVQMGNDEWSEGDWERFFRRNKWIFGYGLSYHFLTTVQNQPHYGGTELDGRGAQRGDFLARTEADVRFTVVVDIKKPSTPLLVNTAYRGEQIFRVAEHVAGGVAQLQANCATWFREGSMRREAIDLEIREHLHTHEPKGILVVGHTREFENHAGRIGSFERFRRSLHNPEILTFDELLARASYLVETNFEMAEAEIIEQAIIDDGDLEVNEGIGN
jgi:hypothetical protein